jgi:hypothetical protein
LFIAIHESQTECLCVREDNKRIMSHEVPKSGVMKLTLRSCPVGFVRSELTSELILSGLLHRIHGLIYVDNRHDEEEIMEAESVAHGDEDERSISGLLCQLLKLDGLPKQAEPAVESAGFVLTARHAFRILEIAALRMHGSGGELEAAACAFKDRESALQIEEQDREDEDGEMSPKYSVLEMLGKSKERRQGSKEEEPPTKEEAARAVLEASRNEMVKAVHMLLPRLLNPTHRMALVHSALSDTGHVELHRRLGPLYGPLFGNPTGHYKLDLSNHSDKLTAQQLNITNNVDIAVAVELNANRAHKNLIHGTNFRNAFFQGAPILDYSTTPPRPHLDNSFFEHLPKKGVLEFDYVSTARPAMDVQPMPRVALNKLLDDVNASRHCSIMELAQQHIKDQHIAAKKWMKKTLAAAKQQMGRSRSSSKFGRTALGKEVAWYLARKSPLRNGSKDSGGSLRRSSTLLGGGRPKMRKTNGGALASVRTVSGSRRTSGILSKTTPSSRRTSELTSYLITPAASRTLPQQRAVRESVRGLASEFAETSEGEPADGFVASTTVSTITLASQKSYEKNRTLAPIAGAGGEKMGQMGHVGYGRRKRGVKADGAIAEEEEDDDEEKEGGDILAALPMKPLSIDISGLGQVKEDKGSGNDSSSSSSSDDEEQIPSGRASPTRSPGKSVSPARSRSPGFISPVFGKKKHRSPNHKKRSASAKAKRQAGKARKTWEKEVHSSKKLRAPLSRICITFNHIITSCLFFLRTTPSQHLPSLHVVSSENLGS